MGRMGAVMGAGVGVMEEMQEVVMGMVVGGSDSSALPMIDTGDISAEVECESEVEVM